ncbi:hypothetical protein ACIG3E_33340 [Streptomyces sp. NPDC053474]|uniref:hypothetical protein n=1 Tax=Streptomyces sp. NPDC053474 TaxID=3365704 RepID=UPI0037D4DC9B
MSAHTTPPAAPAADTPTVRAAVPALGAGAAGGWRRLLTAIAPTATGAHGLEGPWLPAGATAAIPAGALIVAVDHHPGPPRWDITALRATTPSDDSSDGDGVLIEAAHFSRRSPLGRREITALRRLLAPGAHQHTARLLTAPNRKPGRCRHCDRPVATGQGLVRYTPTGSVLLCAACPDRPRQLLANLTAGRCAVCSGWVAARTGTAHLVHDRYQPAHHTCPDQVLPGPPLRADAWCKECRTPVKAGTGYWQRGPHHAPGTCPTPADGLPRWVVPVPARQAAAWHEGQIRRIHHTPRPGEPLLPEGLPGGRILAESGHMSVLAHVLALRTTRRGRTLALVRAATWPEAVPQLAAEVELALAARPDGATFLARAVIERICGDRGWVAEITGHDPRYGLSRTFLRPQSDYDQADARGHRGIFDAWTLRPRRVYELSRPIGPARSDWRRVRRTWGPDARVTNEERAFVRVNADGDIIEITREEVEAWLSTALEWMS